MNISGRQFDGQSDMSWQTLGLCCVAANPYSVHGNDGWKRATGKSRKSATTSSKCIGPEHLSEFCILPSMPERNSVGLVRVGVMKPDMRRGPKT